MTRKTVVRLLILPLLVALLCTGPVLAQEQEVFPDLSAQAALGSAFTYQGRLLDGNLPANGAYDLELKLFDAAAAGAQKGATVTKEDVAVTNGLFTVSLDFGGSNIFNGQALWLQVGVRPGPSGGAFTALAPRTALNAAPFALSLMPASSVSRDFGGNTLSVANGYPGGMYLVSKVALHAWTSDGVAVAANAGTGTGVSGASDTGIGVYATSRGSGRNQAALRASNSTGTNGMAAYITNNSAYHTAHFANAGTGGVLYLQNAGAADGSGGGDFITARNGAENDTQFRVDSAGNVYSDGGYTGAGPFVVAGNADFAEVLPAQGGLEAGDLLAIGSDGALAKAVGAYSTLVAGVYSTSPGYLGNGDKLGQEGYVPLAVVGVVPVKASDQNGPIVPGDLLVASDTPGHVMKGTDRDLMLGAVVGKALSGLDSGTGTVTVLVTLQ